MNTDNASSQQVDTLWFVPQDYTYEEQHVYVSMAWAIVAFGLTTSCEADEIQDDLTVARLRELEA